MFLLQIERGVLKNASVTKSALGRMLDEVLADRSQVLLIKSLFTLQLVLAMCEPTALFFLFVVTNFSFQPKLTKFSFHFLLPRALWLCIWDFLAGVWNQIHLIVLFIRVGVRINVCLSIGSASFYRRRRGCCEVVWLFVRVYEFLESMLLNAVIIVTSLLSEVGIWRSVIWILRPARNLNFHLVPARSGHRIEAGRIDVDFRILGC